MCDQKKAYSCLITLACLLWMVSSFAARAATTDWSGGGADNVWSNAANWGGTTPATGDTNRFNTSANPANSLINLNADYSSGGLIVGPTQNYALTLTNAASTLTIGAYGINMTNAGADLAVNVGGVTLGTNQAWNVGSSRTLSVSNAIAGSATLTKTGAGTLTLTGTNTYSGATTVSAGTLMVNGGGITNTASMTLNGTGASLILTNGASLFSTNTSYIGNGANGTTVFIVSNSLWNAGAKNVNIGYATSAATSNSLTVADGGILTNVIVDFVGTYGNLVITNGGKILAGTAASTWAGLLGDVNNSNSNRVYVGSSTGSKSVWDFGGKIVAIGKSTGVQANWMVVDAGGVISNGAIRIGDNPTANGNGLIITNGGQASLSTVSVGGYNGGYSNCVIVAGTDAAGQPATLNANGTILYVGPSSATGSSGNWVRVEAGGVVTNAQIILGYTGNSVGNSMAINNGGKVFATALTVGAASNCVNNTVTLTSGGLVDCPATTTLGNISLTGSGNTITNNGGILQFTTNTPTIINNNTDPGTSRVVVNSGTVSYRLSGGVVNLTNNWTSAGNGIGGTNVAWTGNNALRLNGAIATNTVAAGYTFANNLGSTNYTRLELVNGTNTVKGTGITVDGANGGALVLSNTVASFPCGLTMTNGPALTLAGPVTVVSNLTIGANTTINWMYSNTSQDAILVTGTLTLPDSATLNVTRVSGSEWPTNAVVFTAASSLEGSASGWVVTGDCLPGTEAVVQGNQVILMKVSRGTLISVN
jgi:autotransporter-associated beta strand protein